MTSWHDWAQRWHMTYDACSALGKGAKTNSLPPMIKPPASEVEILLVEQRLEVRLPPAFRQTLLGFSRGVRFSWYCDSYDCGIPAPPEPVNAVVAGSCHWDLANLEELGKTRRQWVETFCNSDNSFDAVWKRKLVAFQKDGYGNMLALDVSADAGGSVVYLSHDDDGAHGYVLGRDFLDFMGRWSRIGCAGPHSWGWLPFTSAPQSLIDPNCQNARTWRTWLGLEE